MSERPPAGFVGPRGLIGAVLFVIAVAYAGFLIAGVPL